MNYSQEDGLHCGDCQTPMTYVELELWQNLVVIRAGAVDLIEKLAHARLEELLAAIGNSGLDSLLALVRATK